MEEYVRITICVTMTFIFLFGMIWGIGYMMDKTKAKDVEQLTPECIDRCNGFDMTFYEMVNDGWLYDCWCIDDNKPFKVGTLRNV